MNPTPIPQTSNVPPKNGSAKAAWLFLIAFVVLIGLIIWGIIALAGLRGGNDRNIVKNGVATEGISSISTYQGPKKVGRSVTTVVNAIYRYEVDGESYSVVGEKDYKSKENVREGMKATVYYLEKDPEEATVVNEE